MFLGDHVIIIRLDFHINWFGGIIYNGFLDETPQQPQQPQQPSNMSLLYGRAKQYSAAMMSYQQQQGAYKGMKQNEYGYGTEMPTAAVNGSKMDNEVFLEMIL